MVGLLSNKIERGELKPGDHIYSWRQFYHYAHHGIYVGDGSVIHFTRGAGQEIGTGTVLDRFLISSSPSNPSDFPCPTCGDQSKADGVISSWLECFLPGGELYLFQYGVSLAIFLAQARGGTCSRAPSDPAKGVLHRAEYLLQNGFGVYNVFKNNCEDFAIYCKTGYLIFTTDGVGRSGQVSSFQAAARAIPTLGFLTTSFGGQMLVGCGIYFISRIVSDIGVWRDGMKIPVQMIAFLFGPSEPEAGKQTPKEE